MIDSPQLSSTKKGAYCASASNHQPTDQLEDLKKKEAADKEVPVDLNNPEKKF
jgi:hypothetical protein